MDPRKGGVIHDIRGYGKVLRVFEQTLDDRWDRLVLEVYLGAVLVRGAAADVGANREGMALTVSSSILMYMLLVSFTASQLPMYQS